MQSIGMKGDTICNGSSISVKLVFSRDSRMLRGVTQPVRMRLCVCVTCLCVEIFFLTNRYLQAGLTDLDEIWHDGRS